jgi:Xaa-Pro aminopeptidase
VPFNEAHHTAQRVLTEGLVSLGLLEGPVDALLKQEAYLPFYMHRTGHWLGLDVHDAGDYLRNGESRMLEPGMIVTVEPGLYFGPDIVDLPAEFRGIGVRIEDDVLVTPDGPEVLTRGAPKLIPELEALVGQATEAAFTLR